MSAVPERPLDTRVTPFARLQRALLKAWRGFTLRRFAGVLVLCVIVSTQIFFQPKLLEHWSISQIAEGWLYYLAEITFAGVAMLASFALVEAATPEKGPRRIVAVGVALVAGAAIGYALAITVLYGWGFAPAPAQFLGDTLRLATVGGIAALIDALRRRALAAAEARHAAEVARQALAKQVVEARLQLMEAQIEPHFLFNTLANVQRLYEKDPASGEHVLENLKFYLEGALPQMRETRSTLRREIDFARAYLEVLRARMRDRLRVRIDDVPEELGEHAFPTMMLVTLVENAIKHGIHPSAHGGTVGVRAYGRSDRLIVEVADTGVGFRGASGKGVGLANIRARLRLLFGERGELLLSANEPTGAVAAIVVPLAQ